MFAKFAMSRMKKVFRKSPSISVGTEVTTSKSNTFRRMDIHLTDNHKYGICIENKPYALDQKDQLNDYYQELAKRHLYKHLTYLSQELPSSRSVKPYIQEQWQKNNEFSHIGYNDLLNWLTAYKAECQNGSVLEFIQQFIKFIQKQFLGASDISEQNTIINAITENNESIISAIKISTLQKKC